MLTSSGTHCHSKSLARRPTATPAGCASAGFGQVLMVCEARRKSSGRHVIDSQQRETSSNQGSRRKRLRLYVVGCNLDGNCYKLCVEAGEDREQDHMDSFSADCKKFPTTPKRSTWLLAVSRSTLCLNLSLHALPFSYTQRKPSSAVVILSLSLKGG